MHIWAPMLWWFCRSPNDAFASAPVPNGKHINVDFTSYTDLVFRGPCCWVEAALITCGPQTLSGAITVAGTAATGITTKELAMPGSDGGKTTYATTTIKTYRVPYYAATAGAISAPTLNSATLYVNNLFTLPEIHDI